MKMCIKNKIEEPSEPIAEFDLVMKDEVVLVTINGSPVIAFYSTKEKLIQMSGMDVSKELQSFVKFDTYAAFQSIHMWGKDYNSKTIENELR
jgi:hypothetical protein